MSNKKYHYVYIITQISTNMKYIGVRSSNILPEEDLGIKYFSSSSNKEFIRDQKVNRSNYIYTILSSFDTRSEASNEEIKLHEQYNVGTNFEFYNRAKHISSGFDVSGKATVKDKNGNTFQINCDDERYINGELIHINKGKTLIIDENKNIVQIDTEVYKSKINEYTHINTNKVVVKDKDGNIFQVNNDDPRFLSGELVGIAKGKVNIKDKDGNKFQVDINDERYLSEELTTVNYKKILVKDNYNNCF